MLSQELTEKYGKAIAWLFAYSLAIVLFVVGLVTIFGEPK